MLNNHVLDAAGRVTAHLQALGVTAAPRPGNVLNSLYDASVPALVLDNEYASPAHVLAAGSTLETDGHQIHQLKLDRAIALFTKGVAAGQDQAINLVNPAVERVHTSVLEREADLSTIRALRFNVMPDVYSPLWVVPAFETMLAKYVNQPLTGIKIRGRFPERSEQQLREAIYTGVESVDQVVADLLEDYPDDILSRLYSCIYHDTISMTDSFDLRGVTRLKDGSWVVSQSRKTREVSVLAFLLARGIQKTTSDDYSGTTTNFQLDVTGVINTLAYRLEAARKNREVEEKLGRLVLEWPADAVFANNVENSFIVVNRVLYDRFLSEGGSNEVLIGAAQNDRLDRIQPLLEKKDRYLEVYRSNERLLVEMNNSGRLERMRGYVHDALREFHLDYCAQDEYANRESLWQSVTKDLRLLRVTDLDRLWVWIRGVMCRSYFAHSDAIRYLAAHDAVSETMPDETPEVVAYYATMEVLCDLMAEFIELHRA